jgi:N-succinyldiaminopimelate aminotransferase
MPFQPAARVASFGTSVFTEITRLAEQHQAVDLSTGFPDNDGPAEIKEAVIAALRAGRNQYAYSHGEPALRQAVAAHVHRFYGERLDPESQVTVTNGAAEALHSIMDGLINPGDEVIMLEPFYEVYPPNVLMAGGVPRYVPLHPPEWAIDPDELAAAFNERTRMILVNTPHNPTGKVLTQAELEVIADLCLKWNVIAVTDEVYEHVVYDGLQHRRLAQVPGMADRTLTISSMSKTFSFTGWRIGWVTGPADLNRAVRLAHQFVLDCSATPMQYGAARALELDDEYFSALAADYQRKRDYLGEALSRAGLAVTKPASSFFIMGGIAPLGFDDDFEFCKHLAGGVGVAAIPPSAFYSQGNKHIGKGYARFAFCKTMDMLERAAERLRGLRATGERET